MGYSPQLANGWGNLVYRNTRCRRRECKGTSIVSDVCGNNQRAATRRDASVREDVLRHQCFCDSGRTSVAPPPVQMINCIVSSPREGSQYWPVGFDMHVRGDLLNVATLALGQHRDCRIEASASHGRPYECLGVPSSSSEPSFIASH